jgi:isopentenyl-diphosphate delta-isomerase
VILVNENDEAIGRMEKMEAHRKALLHRAFSVFIFNGQGDMLLQQRALDKYHSAGLWTNACCSHPKPGEATVTGALRRLQEELGFTTELEKVFDFVYKSAFDNGLTEYEFDHVFVGYYEGEMSPDPREVSQVSYLSMEDIEEAMRENPGQFTAWFHIAMPMIKNWLCRRA